MSILFLCIAHEFYNFLLLFSGRTSEGHLKVVALKLDLVPFLIEIFFQQVCGNILQNLDSINHFGM
jgi:hypothetical protein